MGSCVVGARNKTLEFTGGRHGSWDLGSDYNGKSLLADLAEPVYVNRLVLGGKPNEQQVAGQQRRTEARRDPLHQLRRVEIRVTV